MMIEEMIKPSFFYLFKTINDETINKKSSKPSFFHLIFRNTSSGYDNNAQVF